MPFAVKLRGYIGSQTTSKKWSCVLDDDKSLIETRWLKNGAQGRLGCGYMYYMYFTRRKTTFKSDGFSPNAPLTKSQSHSF